VRIAVSCLGERRGGWWLDWLRTKANIFAWTFGFSRKLPVCRCKDRLPRLFAPWVVSPRSIGCKVRARDQPSRPRQTDFPITACGGKTHGRKGKSACGVYLPDLDQQRPQDVPAVRWLRAKPELGSVSRFNRQRRIPCRCRFVDYVRGSWLGRNIATRLLACSTFAICRFKALTST
jgi:hypothetical protein